MSEIISFIFNQKKTFVKGEQNERVDIFQPLQLMYTADPEERFPRKIYFVEHLMQHSQYS